MKLRSMKPGLLIPACALAVLPYAHALDIAGHVVTKLLAPIADAKICLKSAPAQCVSSDAAGAFRISDGNSGVRASSSKGDGFALAFGRSGLSLSAPVAAKARLEWTDAGGRVVSAAQDLDLAPGRNALAFPGALHKDGLYFVRLYMRDLTLTWKALFLGESGAAAPMGARQPGSKVAALSKASAAPGQLEISKTGYLTRSYQPAQDVETDAVITLAANGDTGLTFTSNQKSTVLSIDRTNHVILDESVNLSCDTNLVVKDTTRDTSMYAIRNGNLYLWTMGNCTGSLFSGTGTDPVGTWTLVEQTTELPADLKSPGCVEDSASSDGSQYFTGFSGSSTISETEISNDLGVDVCAGNIYVPELQILMDSTVQLTQNTCQAAAFKNAQGETATLNFTRQGDSLHSVFTYKTATCSLSQNFNFTPSSITCPNNGPSAYDFFTCVLGSGFSKSPSGLMKSSAGSRPPAPPMSMEKGHLSIFPFHGRRISTLRP